MKTPYDAATRWKKQLLDDMRRELAELLRAQEEIDLKIAALDAELLAEQQLMADAPLLNHAAFATRTRARRTALEADMVELELQASQLQARITEAFQDFKGLDIASERFKAAARHKQAAAETAALDEVSLQRHLRLVSSQG